MEILGPHRRDFDLVGQEWETEVWISNQVNLIGLGGFGDSGLGSNFLFSFSGPGQQPSAFEP